MENRQRHHQQPSARGASAQISGAFERLHAMESVWQRLKASEYKHEFSRQAHRILCAQENAPAGDPNALAAFLLGVAAR